MLLSGKKLGILLANAPASQSFRHGVRLAEAALAAGAKVYVYCIDDAVAGVDDPFLQTLRGRGLNLYGCAYAARRRNLPITDQAAFAGLSVVSDLIAATDRFLAFS